MGGRGSCRAVAMRRKYFRKRGGPKICSYIGCRNIVEGNHDGRCSEHSKSREMSDRQKASKKFLNSRAWLRCRARKLAEHPWCERCATMKDQPVPAVDVHHIKPRESHPELSLTPSNLMSLCKPCHTIIEKSEPMALAKGSS